MTHFCLDNAEKSKVILFGCGFWGIAIAYVLEHIGFEVVMGMDNDCKKHGTLLWNHIPCNKPQLYDDKLAVILTVENEDIKKILENQCKNMGYQYIYDIEKKDIESYMEKMPDDDYLVLQYCLRSGGKYLDLKNPITFNEKLQWLKLYDRKQEYKLYVDKFEAKRVVGAKIGEEYIIPTIGVWNNVDEIDFDKMPGQYVLKCTHDSGSVVICNDKYTFDCEEAKNHLRTCLETDYYISQREWVYKDITPRVMAEVYMTNSDGNPPFDYKIFCFNGEPKLIQVDYDRFKKHERNVYTTDWERVDVDVFLDFETNRKRIDRKVEQLDAMLNIAKKLSEGIPFVRVDLYIVQEKIYFGEMTFYPGAGHSESSDHELEKQMGDWITLSK